MGNILDRSAKIFAAGCCVYFAMAACSGGGDSTATNGASSSSGGANASSGSSGASNGSSGSPVPNAMADDWYASGSRLKIQYYEATDGAKTFVGLFDSMRNEACGLGVAADSMTRCLPSAAAASYFRDSGCTMPAALGLKTYPAPLYLSLPSNSGRRFSVVVYSGSLYGGAPGSCVDLTATYVASFNFYGLGTEVDASSFVAATLKTSQ